MVRYLFVLGRNVELSTAEVFAFFDRERIEVKGFESHENGLLVDLDEKIGGIVDNFGGVIAIGEVLVEGDSNSLLKKIDKIEIYSGVKNNMNYVLWDFSSDKYDDVSNYLKRRFKGEKLRATEKKLRGDLKLQDKKTVSNVPSKNKIDEQFFVFQGKKICFGKIIEQFSSEEIEKRDMRKPVRREELAISPRLAKIMINLSKVRKNEILVDPFCGIGVVLQEALIQDIRVFGVDKDKNAVSDSKKNLEWFGFSKKDYSVFVGDSRNFNFPKSNVVVSEPHLGDILKKVPTNEVAGKMLRDFERLIMDVLENLRNRVSGRIVFTSPYIRTMKGRVGFNEEVLKGFRVVNRIPEFRENQIVGREIFVLE